MSPEKDFALQAVTGILALFGNEATARYCPGPSLPPPTSVHASVEPEELELELSYSEQEREKLEAQLQELRHLSSLLTRLKVDAALFLLLLHVRDNRCLKGHPDFSACALARQLHLDSLHAELALRSAEERKLFEQEKGWTASWHATRLSKAGEQQLEDFQRAFLSALPSPLISPEGGPK